MQIHNTFISWSKGPLHISNLEPLQIWCFALLFHWFDWYEKSGETGARGPHPPHHLSYVTVRNNSLSQFEENLTMIAHLLHTKFSNYESRFSKILLRFGKHLHIVELRP